MDQASPNLPPRRNAMMIPDDACESWMALFFFIGLVLGLLTCWAICARVEIDKLREEPKDKVRAHLSGQKAP
jgi:hypothetical protein